MGRRRQLNAQSKATPVYRATFAAVATIALCLVEVSGAFQAFSSPRVLPTINGRSNFCNYQQRAGISSVSLLKEPRGVLMESTSSRSKDEATSPPEQDIATALETASEDEKAIYKSAILRTLAWVGAATLFGVFLLVAFGPETSEEFFAGYLVEQSLSVDNLFVFLLLFEYFNVPSESQDRVLNWGIFGAIVMRATMIGIGAAALQNFHAILLVFAAVLVYSSAKALIPSEDEEEEDPSENAIVKFSQSIISSTQNFDGDRFFTMVDGVKKATPLFICMIAVEISDVVFAVDSIPAVFGVTEVRLFKVFFILFATALESQWNSNVTMK